MCILTPPSRAMLTSALATTVHQMTGGRPVGASLGASLGGGASQSLHRLLARKSGFLMQTFAMLFLQLAVTALVAWSVSRSEGLTVAATALRALLGFAIILVVALMVFLPMAVPVKAAMFTLMSALMGALLAPIATMDPRVLFNAMGAVMSVFAAMFLLGLLAALGGANLALLGVFLFLALLGATVWRFFMLLNTGNDVRAVENMLWGVFVAIFGLYMLFDTWNILRRDYEGDFVTAAADYYFDIINLFLRLLQGSLVRDR